MMIYRVTPVSDTVARVVVKGPFRTSRFGTEIKLSMLVGRAFESKGVPVTEVLTFGAGGVVAHLGAQQLFTVCKVRLG